MTGKAMGFGVMRQGYSLRLGRFNVLPPLLQIECRHVVSFHLMKTARFEHSVQGRKNVVNCPPTAYRSGGAAERSGRIRFRLLRPDIGAP